MGWPKIELIEVIEVKAVQSCVVSAPHRVIWRLPRYTGGLFIQNTNADKLFDSADGKMVLSGDVLRSTGVADAVG